MTSNPMTPNTMLSGADRRPLELKLGQRRLNERTENA
mgnify:CR=1 FL=1